MKPDAQTECCPAFDPEPWDDKEIHWMNKKFVQDRVRSFFHIPLNFGKVMKRNMALIEAAGAVPSEQIVLSDENSPWGADVYIHVAADVPEASMTEMSGSFYTKVFEGPHKNVKQWVEQTRQSVVSRGQEVKRVFCYYTTCPKCAKKYGKNYVVILTEI